MLRSIKPLSLALTVVLLAGCGAASTQGSAGPASGSAASAVPTGTVATPPSVAPVAPVAPATLPADAGHVHGVAVTTGGEVRLGTHYGTYAVSAAGVSKVGDASDDLMGFTASGSRLLASGHPGPGSSAPNPLGLMESRDGGVTWQTLSHSGVSDFHALTASGRTVYGFDGTLKVSTDDGRTWADRGAGIAPAVLAAHPGLPSTVLATTAEGVQRSTDGGNTFSAVGGDLILQTVSWPSTRVLFGIEPSGQVHLSADGGSTWTARGRLPGQPHAFAAADGRTLAAATADGVYLSRDGGATFRQLAVAG